ncbi:Cyclic di-GMP phosphodiesterase response regulator RpfG [Gimesia alba]|uniref:Cyclic di-GMP phosphodiesterase response regulator RpfG n=1 Tax=Gimesia alba TaxID=2527973 RepID=A0A517RB01_9PLAN|nr:HD domain-containing phosphohydrolase [Gimesia alba]QDT40983.1 Cyclic di-GMP phosphodiesterase response regulator RpfG [Gimesia alba]
MVAKSINKKASPYSSLGIDRLRIGVKLQAPIFDADSEKNLLLLASGKTITKGTIENLKKRGIRSVRVHERDLHNLMLAPGESQDSQSDSPQDIRRKRLQLASAISAAQKQAALETQRTHSPWQIQTSSFLHEIRPVPVAGYSNRLKTKYREQFTVLTKITDDIYKQLLLTKRISMPQIYDITSMSFSQMAQDMDLFVLEGIAPIDNGNFCRHGLQMSSLAMAIGTQLGLSRENLTQLSIGCLLHDTGMNKINYKALMSETPLSPIESLELKKHPIITFDLLSKVHEVPTISKLIAYQIHERCDGSGYPRGQKNNQIHPLAKIAAVADEFIELVSSRPNKMGLLPYQAAENLVFDASQGLFDRNAVRALLQSMSLYPLGSLVELNNGQRAIVVRTNRIHYDNPIVEILDKDGMPQLTNLLDYDDMHVVRAVSNEEMTTPIFAI